MIFLCSSSSFGSFRHAARASWKNDSTGRVPDHEARRTHSSPPAAFRSAASSVAVARGRSGPGTHRCSSPENARRIGVRVFQQRSRLDAEPLGQYSRKDTTPHARSGVLRSLGMVYVIFTHWTLNVQQQRPRATCVECKRSGIAESAGCGGWASSFPSKGITGQCLASSRCLALEQQGAKTYGIKILSAASARLYREGECLNLTRKWRYVCSIDPVVQCLCQ